MELGLIVICILCIDKYGKLKAVGFRISKSCDWGVTWTEYNTGPERVNIFGYDCSWCMLLYSIYINSRQ